MYSPNPRRRRACLALAAVLSLAACADDSTAAGPTTTAAPTTTTVPRAVNPLVNQPEAEVVADGFEFLDGIAWSQEEGALFFTDAAGQLLRLDADDSVSVVESGVKTRDFEFDTSGRLVATETDDRRVPPRTLTARSRSWRPTSTV